MGTGAVAEVFEDNHHADSPADQQVYPDPWRTNWTPSSVIVDK
jgi:hypothetical protein